MAWSISEVVKHDGYGGHEYGGKYNKLKCSNADVMH